MAAQDSVPSLRDLKSLIPKKCFDKSLTRSLVYLVRDVALCVGLWLAYPIFCGWPLGVGHVVYWALGGFFMWCLFVVGHDCGHSTFSSFPVINDLVGHLCHSPLLVPFWPWARSHHKHHSFHQHIGKDVSHPWLTAEQVASKSPFQRFFLRWLAPNISFPLYLLGVQGSEKSARDGSHFMPLNLYHGSSVEAKLQCLVSAACVVVTGMLLFSVHSGWTDFALRYVGCWLNMCWWLFAVTYMQHHHEDETKAFDGSSWTFLKGALQTVDRTFGFGIDNLHHNITDGHVVHHLFFTKIPHYHLLEATKAIQGKLGAHYKQNDHSPANNEFFVASFWKLFLEVGFVRWSIGQ